MLRMRDLAKTAASISMPSTTVDLAIAAAITYLSVNISMNLPLDTARGANSVTATASRPFDALAVALTIAIGAALVVRRRYPAAVLGICVVLVAVFETRGYWQGLNELGLQLAFFTVASRHPRRWTAVAALVVYPELLYSNLHEWPGSVLDIWLVTTAQVVVIGLIGDGARRLTSSHALMSAYSDQLQRKQRDREQRAVLIERIRIARELHDVTAHHLSVIAVQAGMARYVLDSDPKTADQALRTISEVGSEGLAELRRLISLLRPDEDEGAGARTDDRPAPGIAQLPVLIERVGLSGTPSSYSMAGHRRPLPAGIELCVYRVVQESLTNVLKHAPGSSVDVRLEYAPEQIRVTVTDSGPYGATPQRPRSARSAEAQAAHAAQHSGSGVGLTGMRERAALYGGELSAGWKPTGGFEVQLTLPVDAADSEDPDLLPAGASAASSSAA